MKYLELHLLLPCKIVFIKRLSQRKSFSNIIIIIIIIIIMVCWQHGFFCFVIAVRLDWSSLLVSPLQTASSVRTKRMHIFAGRSTLLSSCPEVHWKTSSMSLFSLLQQCTTYLVRISWMVCKRGSKWPYTCYFVGCCSQDSSAIPILVFLQVFRESASGVVIQ